MIRSMFTDGFRAAPGFMTLTLVFTVLAALGSVTYVVGFALIANAVVAHRAPRVVVGAVMVGVLYTFGWASQVVGATERAGLTDRVTLYLRTRLAVLVGGITTVEHFERPDYLQELDLLRENDRMLAAAPGQVLAALQTALSTIGIVVLLTLVSPVLLVLPLFAVPPLMGSRISVRLRERSDARVAEQRRLANEVFALATSSGPAKQIRLSGLQEDFIGRYESLGRQITSATIRAVLAGAAVSALGWIIFAVGFVGGILLIAVKAAHGQTSIGEVVLAISLLRRAQLQVGQTANLTGQLGVTARTARRLHWLEDYARDAAITAPHELPPKWSPAVDDAVATGSAIAPNPLPRSALGQIGRKPPEALTSGITLRGITFRYPGAGHKVLHDVDLFLPAGSTVAIVGENGAGKTTLVKLLCGMYAPDSGSILLDEIDLSSVDLEEWRLRISVTFQDFVSYQLMLGQAVGVGDLQRIEDISAISAALARADAQSVVDALSRGLETPLGRSFADGQDLSGGQWQKLALSRGMMRDRPLLMVLDEPTASLDAPTEHAIFERSMRQAQRAGSKTGAITILISHRFSTVRMADLIVVLGHGAVLEAGTHRQLLDHGGSYAELFEMQARSYR